MLRLLLSAALVVGLSACSDVPDSTVPVYQAQTQSFAITIDATGEIEAADAKKIMAPGRRPMMLAWLAPENTYVNEGDVIARFDAEQLTRSKREEEFAMLKIQQDIITSEAAQNQEKKDILSEQAFVEEEFAFVDKFAIDDLRLYSKLEIIDTLQNRDFLEAKDDFLEWKESSVLEQHASEMSVLDIKKQGFASKMGRYQAALSQLEVRATHSGLLIYEKDRRGEKPAVGNTVFPGSPIAQIPDLDNLQTKLYIQANDAIDLAVDQAVTITLDAFPELNFTGKVNFVSKFPRTIERGNPVKFYELTASIDRADTDILKPGRKVSAQIAVKAPSERLAVPLQSVMYEPEGSFVLVKDGSEFEKRRIETGRKNLYFIEVTAGLNEGEQIALSAVNTNTGSAS
jgi:multidrug efflux pump subunit AcrA (membrane-fusion protein)